MRLNSFCDSKRSKIVFGNFLKPDLETSGIRDNSHADDLEISEDWNEYLPQSRLSFIAKERSMDFLIETFFFCEIDIPWIFDTGKFEMIPYSNSTLQAFKSWSFEWYKYYVRTIVLGSWTVDRFYILPRFWAAHLSQKVSSLLP